MSDAVDSASGAAGMSSMEGSGYYNRNSAMQAAGIALMLPFWKEACRTAELGNEPLVIADYGSSQGSNSMAPMRIAIEELRDRAGRTIPVQVFHADLPSNDFSALFDALQNPTGSYSAGLPSVFPAAIGRSYFEQLLPPRAGQPGMEHLDDPLDERKSRRCA